MSQIREEVSFTKGRVIVAGSFTPGRSRSAPITSFTTSRASRSQSLRPKTTTTGSAAGCSRPWITPRRSTCRSCSARTATAFVFHDRTGKTHPVERELALDEFRPPRNSGNGTACGKASRRQAEPVVAQDYCARGPRGSPVTTRSTPSTAPSRPSPTDKTAFSWSWRPAPAKTFTPSKSSGGSGSRPRNASLFSPTATSSWTRRKTNDFKPFGGHDEDPKVARWTSPTRSTSPSTRACPAPRSGQHLTSSSRRISSTSSSSTSAIAGAPSETPLASHPRVLSSRPLRSA